MICLADFGNINSLSDSSAVDTMIDNAFISRARKPETSDLIDNICQIAILAQRHTMGLWNDYLDTRGFPHLHNMMLHIDPEFDNISTYVNSHLNYDLSITLICPCHYRISRYA